MMHRLRIAIPWALGGILLFVVFSAARIGIADLLFRYVRDEIAAWYSMGRGPDVSGLTAVSSRLAIAGWLSPEDPDLHENVARVALMRSRLPGTGAAERKALLEDGLVAIRRAITLRPVSPYAWGILLRVKEGLGEYDAEFRRALHGAAMLGPGEPELRVLVVDVGLRAWAALPGAEQAIVIGSIQRGLRRQGVPVPAIAQVQRSDCADASRDSGCAR